MDACHGCSARITVGDRLSRSGARNNMASASRIFMFAILSVALLVSVAKAQQATSGTGNGQKRHQQKADKSMTQTSPKADEKAYNATLKSLPNKPYDPWLGTR
jgi:hypothetical protein